MRVTLSAIVTSLTAVGLLVSPARAEVPRDPPAPQFIGSGEGYAVRKQIEPALLSGCAREDTANKRRRLDEAATHIAAMKDEWAKKIYTTWLAEARTWLDAHAQGVPGIASWAELEKAYTEAVAVRKEFEALPLLPPPVKPEHLHKYVPFYVRMFAVAKRARDYSGGLENRTLCAFAFKDFSAVSWALSQHEEAIRKWTAELTGKAVLEAGRWSLNVHFPDGAPPAHYWGHVTYVEKALGAVKRAREVKELVDASLPLGPTLEERHRTSLEAAAPELDAALAAWGPKAAAELTNVEMPPMRSDAARTKALVRALAGNTAGKQVGPVSTGGAVSKDSWTEQVVVARETNGVWVRDVKNQRDYYSVYYGWQPTPETAAAPELPGFPRGKTCELWAMGFARSSQGNRGPSGAFVPTDSWVVGYLPCGNLTKISKRKL